MENHHPPRIYLFTDTTRNFSLVMKTLFQWHFLSKLMCFYKQTSKTEVLIDGKLPTTYNYNTSTEAANIKELHASF